MKNTSYISFESESPTMVGKVWHEKRNIEERSTKYNLALNEMYNKVLSVPHECGAYRVLFVDGDEHFHWHGRGDILSTLSKHKDAGAREIHLIHTHPLSYEDSYSGQELPEEKARRKIIFTRPEDVRPMPPTLSDFYNEIIVESALRLPVRHKIIDAHTLWHYDFDMTSEFIQRLVELVLRGGEEEVEHNHLRLEKEFPRFAHLRALSDTFTSPQYKTSPDSYVQQYIDTCRLLGIAITAEPIANIA